MAVINFPGLPESQERPAKTTPVMEPSIAPEFYADELPVIDMFRGAAKLAFTSLHREADDCTREAGGITRQVAVRVTVPASELRAIGQALLDAADQAANKSPA